MKRKLTSLLLALCMMLAMIPATAAAAPAADVTPPLRTEAHDVQSVAAGWKRDANGWRYENADGSYPANRWQQIDGAWYHFDANGYMQTGWLRLSGTWYYLNQGGAMATGWKKIDNVWYYFTSSGAMQTGWKKIDDMWYHFSPGGAMQTGWREIDGVWYHFASGGAMQTGWQKIGNVWYYFASSGAMQTGWVQSDGKWYYMGDNGALAETMPTAEQAYARIIAMKSSYPEGKHWTNEDGYVWTNRLDYYGSYYGFGCVAFAMILSDAAYGTVPARSIQDYTYEDLHVGDILRINGNSHSVSILEIYADHVVIAEGNYNSSIHWGRTLTKAQVMAGDYLITRWP